MAVHTHLSKIEILGILANYNLGNLKDYQGIKDGIENTNYLIITEKTFWALQNFNQCLFTCKRVQLLLPYLSICFILTECNGNITNFHTIWRSKD